ncbi:MAG: SDR family oxidoreductase [Gammaproteobacteria bacterium]|jgi:short-subunit dehydrogenase
MKTKRIILTGAGGGIGSCLAGMLSAEGARLCLTDINEQALQQEMQVLSGTDVHAVAANIASAEDRDRIVAEALREMGGIDILINAAGINPFGVFAEQDAALIQRTLEINAIGPMLLARTVLPTMLKQNSGQIVNIGSTFGSIGFAWFSAYSASKFALRGFSQSLRRELADTGIEVTYIAPRAVRTAINSTHVYNMAADVKMKMDEPEGVAARIISSIRRHEKERYIGFPESLFVRINSIMPGLVDRAVRKQNRRARSHAEQAG